jgi:transposase
MDPVLERLAKIETALQLLVRQRTVRDYYSTEDVAQILGKSSFTVREWCRLGRIHAEKRASGRGTSLEWMISHEELERIQGEGLLPAKH